jgi:hypothetical protein
MQPCCLPFALLLPVLLALLGFIIIIIVVDCVCLSASLLCTQSALKLLQL